MGGAGKGAGMSYAMDPYARINAGITSRGAGSAGNGAAATDEEKAAVVAGRSAISATAAAYRVWWGVNTEGVLQAVAHLGVASDGQVVVMVKRVAVIPAFRIENLTRRAHSPYLSQLS